MFQRKGLQRRKKINSEKTPNLLVEFNICLQNKAVKKSIIRSLPLKPKEETITITTHTYINKHRPYILTHMSMYLENIYNTKDLILESSLRSKLMEKKQKTE